MEKYIISGVTLTDIANTIRFKKGTESLINPSDFASEIEGIESGDVKIYNEQLENIMYGTDIGGKSFYDEFWDDYQINGTRRDYNYAFFGHGWTEKTFKPKYPLIFNDSFSVFQDSDITEIPECNVTACPEVRDMFNNASMLKKIEKLILDPSGTQTFTRPFKDAEKLENLNVEGVIGNNGFEVGDCKNLSKSSIESIINALSENTSGFTVTLSTVAVDRAFGGENMITEKNFTDIGFVKMDDESFYVSNSSVVENKTFFVNNGNADRVIFYYEYKNNDTGNQGVRFYMVYKDGTTETSFPVNKTEYTSFTIRSNKYKVLDHIYCDWGSATTSTRIRNAEIKKYGTELDEWADLIESKPNWTVSLI